MKQNSSIMYIFTMLLDISEIALNYFGKWWLEFECHWWGFNMKFEVLGNCNWDIEINIKWT